MKATEKMINAACQEAPHLQREDVTRIVQAALNTSEGKSDNPSVARLIGGALAASGFLTFVFVIIASVSSGSLLDPRVWSGDYVLGDTLASSISNGTWMMDAASGTTPWGFLGSFALFLVMIFISKTLKR